MVNNMSWQTVTVGAADTERLGELMGKQIKAPELIELRSDLGGGKTTFVRGLARGLGSKDIVSSPSFTLKNIYKVGKLEIHHFDFYRLDEPGILSDQLSESLADEDIVTIVEWSDIVQDVLPEERVTVEFKPLANNTDERQITVYYPENKSSDIRRLESEWAKGRP